SAGGPLSATPPPPPAAPPVTGTIAERSALATEDANGAVSAADLAATGPDPFAGKTIVRVETVTVGRLWESRERVTSVRAGDPWSAEAGRRAVREMLEKG